MTEVLVKGMRAAALAAFVFVLGSFAGAQAPAKRPAPAQTTVKVTQIDEVAFKKLLAPAGKPLLINFWATWCDPCREEFPELVELDKEYKGKISFITVSLDDPGDINTTVPKFLTSMKAEMPAYLLKTADESGVISSISKSWSGGMPFTALYNAKGDLSYFREGKVVMATMREELNKLVAPSATAQP
jgi:thiol-disulfide isomerase/thioredoxin